MGAEENEPGQPESTQGDGTAGPVNDLHGDVSGAREIAIRQREAQMVELRLAGVSVDAIAEQFGVHYSRVSHIIARAMRRTSVPATELKELELRRLDRLIYAYWRDALGVRREERDEETGETKVHVVPADPKAAEVVIKALDRRHKLLGLDKIVVEVGMSQEERISALADSMRAYLQGRRDMAQEGLEDLEALEQSGDSA